MKTLTEYFTETPIRDDFDSLCDSDLSCETDRTQVNELVLNFVIKYLALYLGVEHAHIAEMRERICELVDEAYEDDKLYNPFLTGVQVDHIYGNDPGVDYFPLSCIADIRQTAAIFKEIMFNKGFTASDTFTGLDFGSGTGILLIAMLIAAKRNAIQEICCKGIEIREMTAGKSRSAISHLMQGDDSNIEIIHQNIFRGDFLGQLLKKFPPNYIVSETISRFTQSFKLSELHTGFRDKVESTNDPFVMLLRKLIQFIPDFEERVSSGSIAMFPDALGQLYMPAEDRSRIKLATGVDDCYTSLHEIGREFSSFEDFGYMRWKAPKGGKAEIDKKSQQTVISRSQTKFPF